MANDATSRDIHGTVDGVEAGAASDGSRDLAGDTTVLPPTDSTTGNACASGLATLTYSAGQMAICGSSGTQVNQCLAGSLCNVAGGWSLCTASQYLQRGGDSLAASSDAWLESCIRDGGPLFAPTDQICSSCDDQFGTAVNHAWLCGTGVENGVGPHLKMGVHAYNACRRIGENAAATGGYWVGTAPSVLLDYAVCCQ